MLVRPAQPEDLEAVAAIAVRGWWDAYRGLLRASTIEAVLTHTYSERALRHRWEDHPMFLAVDRVPIAFAEAFIEDERIVLGALFVASDHRRRGIGSLLLEEATSLRTELPVTSDVLLGAASAEVFYESHGFVPGETMKSFLYGEPIVERRWWREPIAA